MYVHIQRPTISESLCPDVGARPNPNVYGYFNIFLSYYNIQKAMRLTIASVAHFLVDGCWVSTCGGDTCH
jgi:hypothetical protein